VQAHPKVSNTLCISTRAWRRNFYKLSTFQEIRNFRSHLRREAYDVVFDLQGNVKSGLVLSQVKSKQKVGFGKKFVPEWPNMLFTNNRFTPKPGSNIRDDYLSVVKAFFEDTSPNKSHEVILNISEIQKAVIQSILQNAIFEQGLKVVVCPGSAWRNKQLTKEALTSFLSRLQEYLKCNFIILWGSLEEKEVAHQLHQQFMQHSIVVDRLSLPMVQNLMIAADLVVAMDSLPLHLAGTTSTPSFSVFGPSLAQKYKPMGSRHFAFQGGCPYNRTFEKRCPILRTCPTGACIRELSGDGDLFIKFQGWWG
jgi:heptosyltransferase-1